jgi:hypothetical protein
METAILDSIVQSSYEKVIREDRREKKIERMKQRGVYQNNPDYQRQYHTKGNTMIIGIRNKPVMYSQLTPEEKKIYHDREMEKRKKNGKTGMWDYLDLR